LSVEAALSMLPSVIGGGGLHYAGERSMREGKGARRDGR
jgi:hypothetical protein